MKISTYNVNSVNARLDNLVSWLKAASPDIVLLQEIKAEFNNFPFFDLQLQGYEIKVLGQKSYNGVAILSKYKIKDVVEGLPGIEDDNARYIEALIDADGEEVRVASIYVPNGNPPYNDPDDTSKFEYKLKWMGALYKHAANLLSLNKSVILAGDFNVILTDNDVYDIEVFRNNALAREEVRQRLTALAYLGYYDAFKALSPKEIGYTFWDYSGGAFKADFGMRIDYIFVSPFLADRLASCYVDKSPRSSDKPSDHTVLTVEIV